MSCPRATNAFDEESRRLAAESVRLRDHHTDFEEKDSNFEDMLHRPPPVAAYCPSTPVDLRAADLRSIAVKFATIITKSKVAFTK
ncbi:hypothetical protein GUJ93_ZPchr0005g14629 [Zizania palustris]|uniref:Uncharacterized protein n=1 Tax=Zizania palustris TaxID=103762 RepID=A0A8J5SPL8_ZIZPA|nr:hypothetical protein GUJ93_ZPchr0005g14629 [Zizania palustris]